MIGVPQGVSKQRPLDLHLALKGQVFSLRARCPSFCSQVEEGEHPVDVNDTHLGQVAVEGQHLRPKQKQQRDDQPWEISHLRRNMCSPPTASPASQDVLPLWSEVREAVAVHHHRGPADHEHTLCRAHGADAVGGCHGGGLEGLGTAIPLRGGRGIRPNSMYNIQQTICELNTWDGLPSSI